LTVYVVQSGDTLNGIASRFGVSVDDLLVTNNISDPNTIHIGQTLIIPVGGVIPLPTPLPTSATPQALPTNPIATPLATATRDPNVPLPRLTIREAQNAGQVTSEALLIDNSGGAVDLAGWTVRDGGGHEYTFPALMLFQDGAVYLHTGPGANTVTDLYWGLTEAIWATGGTALLSDPSGNLHARYTIP
jgi:murein DD-endopeptidase MepM/ murein hydrolase activator NlpD